MRRTRGPEALLVYWREVATLPLHLGVKDRIIGGRKERTHARTQTLAPLFKRTVEAEALGSMLQTQTRWIAHATSDITALPTHEALEVEATRVV